MTPDQYIENWKSKHFPKVPHDDEWARFKTRVCGAGDPLNPILFASGGEIECEQYGIIGWLNKTKAPNGCNIRVAGKTYKGRKLTHFYQCSLIEARETGTGHFGDWLVSVRDWCAKQGAVLALSTITNGHLYKYLEKHKVFVYQNKMLYSVKTKQP